MALVLAASIASIVPVRAAGAQSKLRAVRGTVGYQPTATGPFSRIFGSYLVQDDQFAVTQVASNGLLQLPDSSEVALGVNTSVQVGQLNAAAAAAPTQLTLVAGTVRFAIKHPAGGQSNYRFVSATSQLAVRGTVGLYSTGPNGDVITCLDCAPGDVTVTAGGNSFPLLTGQTATISIAGVVVVASTVATLTSVFSAAGLNVANSAAATAFAPGIGATAATAGAAAGTTAAVAAGAAAAAGAGIAISNATKPSPTPTILIPTAQNTAVPIQASNAARTAGVAAPGAHRAP